MMLCGVNKVASHLCWKADNEENRNSAVWICAQRSAAAVDSQLPLSQSAAVVRLTLRSCCASQPPSDSTTQRSRSTASHCLTPPHPGRPSSPLPRFCSLRPRTLLAVSDLLPASFHPLLLLLSQCLLVPCAAATRRTNVPAMPAPLHPPLCRAAHAALWRRMVAQLRLSTMQLLTTATPPPPLPPASAPQRRHSA